MKGIKLFLCAILMVSLFGCTEKKSFSGEKELITIQVVIKDDSSTELYKGSISLEGSDLTLEDLLKANADEIQLVSEDTAYGMQVNGLMGVETIDWAKGPWWTYSSENNASCVKAGYCTGASELKVSDGDEFVFSFTTGY